MEGLSNAFSNPFVLTIVIILTLVSTVLCMVGLKQKSPPLLLMGLGAGVPTFDVLDWQMWGIGILLCLLGLWLRSKIDSV